MYVRIFVIVLLAVLLAGCTTPDLPWIPNGDVPNPGTPALSKQWDQGNQTVIISTQAGNKVLTIKNEKSSSLSVIFTFGIDFD